MHAQAQVSVDTVEQRRRSQQESQERERQQQAPDVRLRAAESAIAVGAIDFPVESPCFPIERLVVERPSQAAADFVWLDAYLAESAEFGKSAGRCIGRQGINLIAKRVSALIVSRGYVTTRLGIPEQDLSSKTLRLVLVPGIIRSIRVVGDTPGANWQTAFPARPGDLLNLRDIEQGLEQMKRLPSQDVSVDIAPGDVPGDSDIILTVKRSRPWHLGVSLDDAGARSTGRLQAGVNAVFDNPLGLNDSLSVSLNNDAEADAGQHGTRGHSVQYSIPWGYWTFALADSSSLYLQTIAGVNQTFRTSGDSRNQEIKVQRLVYRDQTAKTTLQLRALHHTSRSYIEDAEIFVQRRHTSAIELALIQRQYLGNAQVDLTLAHRQGVPWFAGQSDVPGHGADQPTFAYHMQTLDLSAAVPFSAGSLNARWLSTLHVQTTRDALYGTDLLAIGGRNTVRGFDGETTLAAERGWYLRNELELPIADSGQALYVGIDHGQVSGPSAAMLAGRRLTGAVVGLRGGGHGIGYDVFAGWAIDKPAGLATTRPAVGFQLSYQF